GYKSRNHLARFPRSSVYAAMGLFSAAAWAAQAVQAYPAFRLPHIRVLKIFRNDADRQNPYNALREAGLPE
ncbi:MAG: hypothetical protein WA888_16295, partial [Burkholderiaceae bacterium]